MKNEMRWIKKIKRTGNESAANALVSKYYNEIYAYLYKQTLDNELSMDLTQEIFISVLKSIKRYDSEKAAFRTWLYKIASNRLVDYYRSKSYRYAQIEEALGIVDIEDTYDLTISLEYKEDYEKATSIVNELEASSQQIMRLKLFGEYTFQEIAAIEDMPISTVKTKYYTSLKHIRMSMKEEYHD